MIDFADVGISSSDDDPRTRPGVYFLFCGDQLVYVGQAHNVVGRVAEHCKYKSFSRSTFVPLSVNDLDFVESYLICFFRPELNKKIPMLGYRSQYARGRISSNAKSFVIEVLENLPKTVVVDRFTESISRLRVVLANSCGWKRQRYRRLIERNIQFARRIIGSAVEVM